MKTEREHAMKLRKGTPEHDAGQCALMLVLMVDFCSPADRSHRIELARKVSNGTLRHEDVVLAV